MSWFEGSPVAAHVRQAIENRAQSMKCRGVGKTSWMAVAVLLRGVPSVRHKFAFSMQAMKTKRGKNDVFVR